MQDVDIRFRVTSLNERFKQIFFPVNRTALTVGIAIEVYKTLVTFMPLPSEINTVSFIEQYW